MSFPGIGGIFSAMTSFRLVALTLSMCGALSHLAQADSRSFYENAPFYYSDTEAKDPVAHLVEQLKSGELVMDSSSDKAFLKDLLARLQIPIASQVLVYSKTSFQNSRILPSRPRALYFSEDYYVGWVQGGDIEIISIDPMLGPIFYVLDIPRPPERKAALRRPSECMNCHGGSRTSGVPGMLVRSVKTNIDGFPILAAGSSQTDHASPIAERWGGWYVTGENAGDKHMGNLLFEKREQNTAEIVRDHGTLKNLDRVINTRPYLTNESDIVALMVMEHQITVHNIITQSAFNTRRWLHYDKIFDLAEIDDAPNGVRENTMRMIRNQADRLLKVMLFAEEIELESWGVEGGEAFQEAFQAKALESEKGRSLKDLELLSRLFKHRLSYMIYSKPFEQLPAVFKDVFYEKLHAILTDQADAETYGYLKKKERARILTILKETKPEFVEHTQ